MVFSGQSRVMYRLWHGGNDDAFVRSTRQVFLTDRLNAGKMKVDVACSKVGIPQRFGMSRCATGQERSLSDMIGLTWFVMTLPFRLVFGVIGTIGRMLGMLLGVALLAAGGAMWAAQLPHFALPVLVVGGLLTLKSLF